MIWDESLEITRFEILFSIRKEDLTESIGMRGLHRGKKMKRIEEEIWCGSTRKGKD